MSDDAAASMRRAAAHLVVADVTAPVLDDEAEHHLFRVLRLHDGETVTVTDGAGRWMPCLVDGGALVAAGAGGSIARRPSPVVIGVAIPKQDRPEWIVQKLTELGVDRIVFLHADRSVVRWDAARAIKHLAKLRTVAREAVRQSRSVWLPEIDGPIAATSFLPTAVAAEPGGRPFGADDRIVAIGPEGGWSVSELARARDRVALGTTVLRVETAAITAGVRAVALDSGV